MGIFSKKRIHKQVTLDSSFFETIYQVVDQLPGEGINDPRVAYSGRDSRQYIQVVGESFCQQDLIKYYMPDKWRYGLLVPEQQNQFDSNAIAVYLICSPGESDDGEFGVYRVGYLDREVAKRVSRDIANLLANSGIVIPILAMVKRSQDSNNLAVVAYAMTDVLSF